jgi:hypothetical protein
MRYFDAIFIYLQYKFNMSEKEPEEKKELEKIEDSEQSDATEESEKSEDKDQSEASEQGDAPDESEESKGKKNKTAITLELGDIVEIQAPQNSELHSNTFFIIYLDDVKLKLVNVSTFLPYELKMDKNGRITDETVTRITILSRSEEKGYARQHMLLPKTWINVRFGGETPTIITGEITNLEEDMIEITTYPDLQVIYIDFAYKGLPEHLPLEQIEIRTKPASLEKIESLVNIRDSAGDEEGEDKFADFIEDDASLSYSETGELIINISKGAMPAKNVKDVLKSMFLEAGDIQFGEELGDITYEVEIPEEKKRYGIETQVNSIMDELLSEIPNAKRTKSVLDHIHFLIDRYRELRQRFSKFDVNGNVQTTFLQGSFFKPLVEHVSALDTKLKWLMPVVALRRKIYTNLDPEDTPDILEMDQFEVLHSQSTTMNDYYNNNLRTDKSVYNTLYERINEDMTPFSSPQFPEDYLLPHQKVAADLESVVSNLNNFYSTVYERAGRKEWLTRQRFVIQRYNLGQSVMEGKMVGNVGRKIYIREPLTDNDTITIKSIMVLPEPVVQFSAVDSPGTSILQQAGLAQNYFYTFRILRENAEILQTVVEHFDKDADDSTWLSAKPEFLKQINEFVLDESLEKDPRRFRRFLEAVLPKTATIIDLVKKHMRSRFTMKQVVDKMEPYKIYTSNITYQQYNKIRFFIKEQIKEFKTQFAKKIDQFGRLRVAKYNISAIENRMERLFFEKPEIAQMFMETYKFDTAAKTESEFTSAVLKTDQGALFFSLIRFAMVSLITPENLLESLQNPPELEEMSSNEKIKADSCSRRFLAKKYSSMKLLQKDNGEADLFYDEELDDSPYELMKKYKDDAKKYSPEDFIDFVAENLIQKHDCPVEMARELASTLIAGKKKVKEGEYALLEIKPHLPTSIDEAKLSEKEKKGVEREAEIKKKTQYYRRVKTQWVSDDTIDENAFIDNNTLFCNMGKICFKNQTSKTCDSVPSAEERMRQITRKQLLQEFDERFVESMENIQDKLKSQIEGLMRQIIKTRMLDEIRANKYNNYAFELGKYAKIEDIVRSPHLELRDRILSSDDFVRKQTDISRFADTFCRDPMVDELGDSAHWLYCKDTNTALLPKFLRELAQEFLSNGNYQRKQDELARTQGIMSDDGDSIVDRHSGYVIKRIDFVEEEGYDEAGFKMVTHEVMEKDQGEQLVELMGKMKDRVFENETTEMIYKIYAAIMRNMSIPAESIDDFVLRTALEVIQKNIESEESYNKMAEKMEKTKGKRPVAYKIYKNQRVLMIVGGVILIGVQTVTPSFKTRKTYPGCIQSFSGYPMDLGSVEDKSGLKYIACVMKGMSSSIEPWNSIKPLPADVLQERMFKIVADYIIDNNSEITELYAKKREYLLIHGDEESVPKDHALDKWRHFLPPIVRFSVSKNLKPLSTDYKSELLTLMREGKSKQREHIDAFKSKILQFGYGIIEAINGVVHGKETLLKTASNISFLENSCCNDRRSTTSIDYFAQENDTIGPNLVMVDHWATFLKQSGAKTRAAMLYHPERTGLQLQAAPAEHFEENVYLAFIYYCNLDKEAPIPEALRGLMSEKPAGYNPKWTTMEKIDFLKQNGKRYSLENLMQLMEIVNREKFAGVYRGTIKGTVTSALKDFLDYLDSVDSSTIESPLRNLLNAVIDKYDPKQMINDDPANPQPESFKLNTYLSNANSEMLSAIVDFMAKNAKGKWSKREYLQSTLANIHIWNLDANNVTDENMYTVIQYLKNSICNMSRVYPEMIQRNHAASTKVKDHWNLAGIHAVQVTAFLKKQYEVLQEFKNDGVLNSLLSDTQIRLTDLTTFLSVIPVFMPIHKVFIESGTGQKTPVSWYSLFNKRTIYMLLTYIWYSVFYEYITASHNDEFLQTDVLDQKEMRRRQLKENADALAPGETAAQLDQDSYLAEYNDDLLENEVEIKMGDKKQLRERVAGLLAAYLEIEIKTKSELDMSYGDIDKKIRKSKQDEKKLITDFLRDMDQDERRVEDLKKQLKLGRWNVGMQKGLVKYDKETYEREIMEMMANENNAEEMDNPATKEVDDLDAEAEADADLEADREAYDIGGLGEEYGDGNYYEEDVDRDDYA